MHRFASLHSEEGLLTASVLDEVEKDGGIKNASVHNLSKLFLRIAGSEDPGEIVCLVEALDECHEEDLHS